jgi:FtsZ-binding cell division protein ZapB
MTDTTPIEEVHRHLVQDISRLRADRDSWQMHANLANNRAEKAKAELATLREVNAEQARTIGSQATDKAALVAECDQLREQLRKAQARMRDLIARNGE